MVMRRVIHNCHGDEEGNTTVMVMRRVIHNCHGDEESNTQLS